MTEQTLVQNARVAPTRRNVILRWRRQWRLLQRRLLQRRLLQRRWLPALRRQLLRMLPRSFLALLAAGFLAVAVPLAGAIVATSFEVDRLAQESQSAITRTVQATELTQRLLEDVDATERTARQFMVLRDRALWRAYGERRDTLAKHAKSLLVLLPAQRDRIALLLADSTRINNLLSHQRGDGHRDEIVNGFAGLAHQATTLTTAASTLASSETVAMRDRAERTRTLLFWQAIALIAVAVGLSWYFLRVIARPVSDMDSAIRTLGEGKLEQPIVVRGPQDFVELGLRLEWLRQRLGELDAKKSRFLRHVSHELKTPMTAIREGSNLLLDEVPGPINRTQREVTEIVRDNARRLEHLIEDLLGVTRLPEGIDYRDDWQTISLDATVHKVLRDHTLSIASKTLQLQVQLAQVSVRGSPSALATIVDNLISNAVKYSPANGVLRVELAQVADKAVLEVEDDGPGIAPDDRDAIFEPFFRGSRQPDALVNGTGLGLTIAREATEAHAGTIVAVADRGHGACMRVTLPISLDTSR